jgi:integrase
VRACFQAAVREGYIDSNPAARIKAYRENAPRARVLTSEEISAFLKALENDPDEHVRAAFHLLIETGARLREVLTAKWEDFDLDAQTWRIPSPKAGRPQTIPIAGQTAALLRNLKRVGTYVIAGRREDKPRADLNGPWKRLKKAAGFTDIHIHDLRRTFGLRVAREAGLHVASKLLRHADVRITERVYTPLGLDDLRPAMERAATVIPIDRKKANGHGQ